MQCLVCVSTGVFTPAIADAESRAVTIRAAFHKYPGTSGGSDAPATAFSNDTAVPLMAADWSCHFPKARSDTGDDPSHR